MRLGGQWLYGGRRGISVKAKLIVALGALVLCSSVQAQFEPPQLEQAPEPRGRQPDTTTDSPSKVDRSVDFGMTQTPLDRTNNNTAAQSHPGSGALDRPMDRPVDQSARTAVTDDSAAKAAPDASVRGGPQTGTATGFTGAGRPETPSAAALAKQRRARTLRLLQSVQELERDTSAPRE